MKHHIAIIIFLFHSSIFAQIKVSGTVRDETGPLPGIKIKISDDNSTLTDLDGKYEFSIAENKKINLLFEAYTELVSLEIKQIDTKKLNESKLNVIIPSRDRISAKDYQQLSKKEKGKYNPERIVSYGYSNDFYASREFQQKFVIIYLDSREIKITNFKYNSEEERVVIDGNDL